MTDEELIQLAHDGMALAVRHEGISVCSNPFHEHQGSPCEDDCMDHSHQCSQGCGEWPCPIVMAANTVAIHLLQLEALVAAHREIMERLQLSASGLSDQLEMHIHE